MKTHVRNTRTRQGRDVTLCGQFTGRKSGAPLAKLGEQPTCKTCMNIKGTRTVRGWP